VQVNRVKFLARRSVNKKDTHPYCQQSLDPDQIILSFAAHVSALHVSPTKPRPMKPETGEFNVVGLYTHPNEDTPARRLGRRNVTGQLKISLLTVTAHGSPPTKAITVRGLDDSPTLTKRITLLFDQGLAKRRGANSPEFFL